MFAKNNAVGEAKLTRKATGPNGIAIVASDSHPDDEQLIDRAMQVGHLEPSSIIANRHRLRPLYAVERNYVLQPDNRTEDMWFVVAEDFADQYKLAFDGIERYVHEQKVVCRLGGEKYVVNLEKDRVAFYKAIRATLETYNRL